MIFDQQTACRAPVPWSKYTTERLQGTSPTNMRASHPFRVGLTEEVQMQGNLRKMEEAHIKKNKPPKICDDKIVVVGEGWGRLNGIG